MPILIMEDFFLIKEDLFLIKVTVFKETLP